MNSDCPSCSNELSYWNVFKSLWPTRVFCITCGASLKYRHGHKLGAFACLCGAMLLVVAGVIAQGLPFSAQISILTGFGLWLLLYEVFMLAFAYFLRRYGVLRQFVARNEKADFAE